jgi:1,5-anhydro-D-fructose reductase (1,5-anhydro-D-mannitol-forming)
MTSSPQPVRWGFAGASTWASRYLIPAVQAQPDADAVAVFSTSRERGARFAETHGLERSYVSIDELVADPSIDAVYISTTNDLHAAQTIAAARAGKHVLCEKPLAVTLADAWRMRDACEDAGVVFGTNHHLRGSATIMAMRKLVEEGAIGEIVAARVFHVGLLPEVFRTWRLSRPETGAGVVLDLTVHDVDMIRFLMADEVEEVTAMGTNQGLADAGIDDAVMGVLRMAGGPLVSFHDAFTVPHAGTGIEVHGTTGSVIGRGVVAPEPVGEVVLKRGEQVEQIDVGERWPIYEHAVRRFSAAVRSAGSPLASGEDGIASLAVALAVTESARTGATVRPARAAAQP